jgi:hypothetical protein
MKRLSHRLCGFLLNEHGRSIVLRAKYLSVLGLMALLPGMAYSSAIGSSESDEAAAADWVSAMLDKDVQSSDSERQCQLLDQTSGSGELIALSDSEVGGSPAKCCWVFSHGIWYCIYC